MINQKEINKLTAVEWLEKEFKQLGIYSPTLKDKCEQAKEMEKEQIIDTFQDSRLLSITNNCNSGEQYYNETFNK